MQIIHLLDGANANQRRQTAKLSGGIPYKMIISWQYSLFNFIQVNAFVQRIAGKGFESEVFYENAKFQFFGIENIHVMRASLQKLLEAAEMRTANYGAFLATLESSGWLRHIRAVLEAAYFVAR